MRRMFSSTLLALTLVALPQLAAAEPAESLPYIDTTTEADGVVELPSTADEMYTDIFSKYTKVVAANGHPIHILALEGVDDDIVAHAASVLRQHLTDIDGAVYGDDKSAVSNAMANNEAILAIFETNDQVEEIDGVQEFLEATNTQDLKEDQIYLEGTDGYLGIGGEIGRNAAFEEILHMTQDYGITPGNPELQRDLNEALEGAIDSGAYTPLEDLEEDSYDQEYFAIGMETFFGFWRHDPSGDGKAGGEEYSYITRSALEQNDPDLYSIVNGYFGPTWQYTALVDDAFTGTFTMIQDDATTYSNRSQYLKNLTLQGSNGAAITGNDYANTLTGNSGDNDIDPGAGDDLIFGGSGEDTLLLSGDQADYTVTDTGCRVTVQDNTADRDGTDTLSGVEQIAFNDTTTSTSATNDQPVLARIYDQNTPKGESLTVDVSATDQDGDDITYTVESSNSNVAASISGTTVTLTPASEFEGSSTITVSASDASCTDTQPFTVYAIGDLDAPAKEIADVEKDGQRIHIRFADDSEETIRPFPGNKVFRYALTKNQKRLVVTNGKVVKVYKNARKVRQKKITARKARKNKQLRLQVKRLYKGYDSVIVASAGKKMVHLGSIRLNNANRLKKKSQRRLAITQKAPLKLIAKKKKKYITVRAGSGEELSIGKWKLTKKGRLKSISQQ